MWSSFEPFAALSYSLTILSLSYLAPRNQSSTVITVIEFPFFWIAKVLFSMLFNGSLKRSALKEYPFEYSFELSQMIDSLGLQWASVNHQQKCLYENHQQCSSTSTNVANYANLLFLFTFFLSASSAYTMLSTYWSNIKFTGCLCWIRSPKMWSTS